MNRRLMVSQSARRPTGRRRRAVYVVVLLSILGLTLTLGIGACAPHDLSPQKAILGKWVNPDGGEISFNADGTGFVPPMGGTPAYAFTYTFQDDAHLIVNVAGQTIVMEIKLTGDKMTWLTPDTSVKFEYTRAK